MLTITALARRFGLARSTLLHYDRLGLLRATERSPSGYRRYGPGAVQRLESICTYRRAGLSLQAIGRILDGPPHRLAQALEARLEELDRDMATLREQQAVLAGLLERPELLGAEAPLDKATWVELLRASGMSDAAMDRWHQAFEAHAPEQHQRFLEVLGLAPGEALRLRRRFGAEGGPDEVSPAAPCQRRRPGSGGSGGPGGRGR